MKLGLIIFAMSLILLLPTTQAGIESKILKGKVITEPIDINKDTVDKSVKGKLKFKGNKNIDIDFKDANSLANFQTLVEAITNGYKWSYTFQLPALDYTPVITIDSETPIELIDGKYMVINGDRLVSFDDVIDYGFTYSVSLVDSDTAEVTLYKDWVAEKYKVGDTVVIDPIVTSYPSTDGFLRRDSTGGFTVNTGSADMLIGSLNSATDYVYRSYITFDTSFLSPYDTITNAVLTINFSDITQTGGQDCNAILESIPNYGSLDSADWNLTGNVTINDTWINIGDTTGIYYNQTVTNYVTVSASQSFRIKSDYEVYGANDCRHWFETNDSVTSPSMELTYIEGTADNEFSNATLFITGDNVHDPKIACEDNDAHCLLMFYDSTAQSVKLKYSWNKGSHYEGLTFGCTGLDYFAGCWELTTYSHDLSTSLDREKQNSYHLPYDVTWHQETNSYYFFIKNDIYKWIPNQAVVDWDDMSVYKWGIQFADDTNIFAVETVQNGDSTNDWELINVVTKTLTDNGKTPSTGGCTGVGGTQYAVENMKGNAFYNDGNLYYVALYGYNGQNCTGQSAGSHPETGSSGSHFYQNGYLYYNLYSNETKRATTTDFSSYGTGETIYLHDSSIGESINNSDSDNNIANRIVMLKRETDFPVLNGLYVFNQPVYTVDLAISVQDLDTGGERPANITASMICSSESYIQTQTDSGILRFSTPCQTGNTISFQTGEGEPNTFDFSYDVLSGCESDITFIYNPPFEGILGTYTFTTNVRDSIFNTGVSSVDLTLSGDAQTTDANGDAEFSITPINGASFDVATDSDNCFYILSLTGSEKEYVLTGEKTGYQSYLETGIVLGQSPFNIDAGDLTLTKSIAMDLEGATAEVHIYTADAIEVFPSNVEIEAIGSNHTFVFANGEFIESNISYQTPTTFILVDSRPSYSANFTLKYYYGENFDYYQQNATIILDSFNEINFYLNENSAELKCSYDSDCPTNLCSGRYYKEFSSCSGNVCQYSTEVCTSSAFCDIEYGCFDTQYTQSCELDAECEDSCLTNYTMSNKVCGSAGKCIGRTVECDTNCSASLGVCSELEACITGSEDTDFRLGYIDSFGYFAGIEVNAVCDFDRAGVSQCVSDTWEILDAELTSQGATINDIVANPGDWQFRRNDADTGYNFYGVLVSCSDTCGLSYEYCEYGCELGSCKQAPTGEQTVYSDAVEGAWNWLLNIVPLELRMLMWGLFTIIAMALYRFGIKGHHGGDKDTLMVGFVVFLIGVSVAWVHWIFLFIIGFIIAFVLWERSGINK